MTPEIQQLMDRVASLEQMIEMMKREQISWPLDTVSKNVLNDTFPQAVNGTGTFSTQVVVVSGGPGNVTVPAQPSGTLKITIRGQQYELLYK